MLTPPVHTLEKTIGRHVARCFFVTSVQGRPAVVIRRPGELDQIILCESYGAANQVRIALAEGFVGLIEGAQ